MTIVIAPETEALLRKKALRDGKDVNAIADAMLAKMLRWEAEEEAETIAGIWRGIEASDAGRVRPFAEFATQMRAEYSLPTHMTDDEIAKSE